MFISIIIATYNGQNRLKNFLDGFLDQQIPDFFDYEVLIVDNNSQDHTRDVVLGSEEQFEGRLHYHFESIPGKSQAINRGIKASKGDVLLFTDDDVIPDQQWLAKIAACYQKYNPDAVGGRVLPLYPYQTPQWIKDNALYLSGAVVIYDNGPCIFPVANMEQRFIGANFSVKRQVIDEVGSLRLNIGPGTSVAVGEDAEFFNRLLEANKKLYYCGEALVWHGFDTRRATLKSMARWNINLGRYAAWFDLKKGLRFITYQGVPRYLFRDVTLDFLKLFVACANKPKFLIAWRDLFCKVGQIQGHRWFFKEYA